eukprot:7700709-Pyramimonas_sp.AAC.1
MSEAERSCNIRCSTRKGVLPSIRCLNWKRVLTSGVRSVKEFYYSMLGVDRSSNSRCQKWKGVLTFHVRTGQGF